MAQLPTVESFGPRTSPRSQRRVIPFSADIVQNAEAAAARQTAQAAGQMLAGIAEVAETMAIATQRIQTRENAVERARGRSAFSEEGATELRRILTEDDLSVVGVGKAYGDFLQTRMDVLIAAHDGSEDSRAALTEQLIGIRSRFIDQAAAMSLTAQRQKVKNVMGDSLNTLIAQAKQEPGRLLELFDVLEADIADMAPALTPDEEDQHSTAGKAAIVEGIIDSYFERGQAGEVERLLQETPGMSAILGAAAQKRISTRLAVIRTEQNKFTQKLRNAEIINGGPLSQAQRAQLFNYAVPVGARTPGQTLTEFTAVMQESDPNFVLTQGHIERAFKVEANEGNVLGGSFAGKGAALTAVQASDFGNRLLNDVGDNLFNASVREMQAPRQIINITTGEVSWVPALPLSQYILDAYAKRGEEPPPPLELPELTGKDSQASGEKQPSSKPEISAPQKEREQSLGEAALRGDLTGPIPTVGGLLNPTPVLGSFAPDIAEQRKRVKLVEFRAINALRKSKRFAQTEFTDLSKRFSLGTSFWDNPQDYVLGLIALDKEMESIREDAVGELNRDISKEKRTMLNDQIGEIDAVRRRLLPPRFIAEEDAEAFAKANPDDLFLFKDDDTWVLIPSSALLGDE